jgi:serine/threonine protein kinase
MAGLSELIGQTLGQYRIVEQVGKGGMATVFKAYQPGLDRYVAVKVLAPFHAEQDGFNARFVREARAIANLHHPNILPVYDSGQERDYSFIVMRYVEGSRTLRDVMTGGLDLTRAADLIGQVAAALDHAHARGIIHRDVKPNNVLMDGDWALLSDFGLAKMTEPVTTLTGPGVGLGTPAYMSPEQGQALPLNHRSDIYSLGVVLFEMLTGQIPHNAETPFAIILKRITEPLPLPRSLNPTIPEPVERALLKALANNPDDRFDSAGAMALAVRAGLRGLPPAEVLSPAAPATPSAQPPFGSAQPPLESAPTAPDAPAGPSAQPPPGNAQPPLGTALVTQPDAAATPSKGTVTVPAWAKPAAAKAGKVTLKTLGWLLRAVGPIVIVILAALAALLVLGVFGASTLLEKGIAGAAWVPIYPDQDIVYSQDEATQAAMAGARLYLPGSVEVSGVDFVSPDRIYVQATLFGTPTMLECTLTSQQGTLEFGLERIGDTRLYLLGSILSGGINRGLKTMLQQRSLEVERLLISDFGITVRYKSTAAP